MATGHIGEICADRKVCRLCEKPKASSEFWKLGGRRSGLRNECKDCCRAQVAAWKQDNIVHHRLREKSYREERKDAAAKYHAGYRAQNREKLLAEKRRYYRDNREKLIDAAVRCQRETAHVRRQRYQTDPCYRLNCVMRAGVQRGLRRGAKGARKTFDLLGYGVADLKSHLEQAFLPGMDWSNYGAWHIDHVRPLASFKFETPDDPEFREAWALSNLQPLWAEENQAKGASFPC